MDEFPCRTFCALLAASAGAVSGAATRVGVSRQENAIGKRDRTDDGEGTVVTTRTELEAAFDDLSPRNEKHLLKKSFPYLDM